ncbi:hypothetical protein [Clostridium sp. D53t1_180928_C8]|uniref:hypothetical protein n=1 Tax=Clostridium sp. D53t1_180928_C8 TaxID=2787101 RepID=UPI0018AB4C31|nr:hypothetical protein [Clostridium sp. D53t1_180928_C8]
MKININSKDTNLSIPVPLSLASTCIRLIPSKEISKEDKKTILAMIKCCKKELKNYKGLEIVNITSADGDKVRIIV